MNVFEIALPYLKHTAPITKGVEKIIEKQYYWKSKLQQRGYETNRFKTNFDLDYKRIYILLFQSNFNADAAYLLSCQNNDFQVAQYLSRYSGLYLECAHKTSSYEIIKDLDLNIDQINLLMLSSINNPQKLRVLVSIQSPIEVAEKILTGPYIESQLIVIDELEDEELMAFTSLVRSKEVGRAFENRGFQFDEELAAKYDLVRSIKLWVKENNPSKEHLEKVLKIASINDATDVVKYITSLTTINMEFYFITAVKKNNLELCEYFLNNNVTTDRALSEAIRSDKIEIVKLLSEYAKTQHLNLANKLHRTEIYNVLFESLQ